jgi:transcriptional regulator with XRE-family HTH domain
MTLHPSSPGRRRLRRGHQYSDLAAYIEATGDTQVQIAAAVGSTQGHISRIVTGAAVPRSPLAARLARYAHIPLDSFTRVYLAKRGSRVA